jgi:hypothetical protein
MRPGLTFLFVLLLNAILLPTNLARAGIYDFAGGVRIPAGSCATYSSTPQAEVVSSSGGVAAYKYSGRIDISFVCQVPVPEKASISQFVMVGNVVKGRIEASLGAVRWNAPRQHTTYASLHMVPTTPFEIPTMNQKKVVQNIPMSGTGSLKLDRAFTYFINVRLTSDSPVNFEEALEIFYLEIYWN